MYYLYLFVSFVSFLYNTCIFSALYMYYTNLPNFEKNIIKNLLYVVIEDENTEQL